MLEANAGGESSLIKKTLVGFCAVLSYAYASQIPYILLCNSELIPQEKALEGFSKHLLKATC